jgi:hypothetical protein
MYDKHDPAIVPVMARTDPTDLINNAGIKDDK